PAGRARRESQPSRQILPAALYPLDASGVRTVRLARSGMAPGLGAASSCGNGFGLPLDSSDRRQAGACGRRSLVVRIQYHPHRARRLALRCLGRVDDVMRGRGDDRAAPCGWRAQMAVDRANFATACRCDALQGDRNRLSCDRDSRRLAFGAPTEAKKIPVSCCVGGRRGSRLFRRADPCPSRNGIGADRDGMGHDVAELAPPAAVLYWEAPVACQPERLLRLPAGYAIFVGPCVLTCRRVCWSRLRSLEVPRTAEAPLVSRGRRLDGSFTCPGL